jgi:hypothetical protein
MHALPAMQSNVSAKATPALSSSAMPIVASKRDSPFISLSILFLNGLSLQWTIS